MSALIRESHANNQVPLWVPASGGTIAGNLTLTGNLQVDGTTNLKGIVETENIVNMYAGSAALPSLQIIPDAGPPGFVEMRTDGSIKFGTLTLTTPPQTSFVPSNTPDADSLIVGGAVIAKVLQGVGPSPNTLITSTKNETPAPVSPAPAVAFGVDTLVPTIVGGEYDVMTRGLITLAAGVADVDDVVNVTLDAGTSAATGAVWTYQFKPSAVGANGYWQIRDRIVSDAVVASLGVTVQVVRAGGSTADYDVSQIQFDVTQVI
jgi:hypothetical protein